MRWTRKSPPPRCVALAILAVLTGMLGLRDDLQAQEAFRVPPVHIQPSFPRPIQEVDLRLPSLQELTEGRSTDAATIPDYAALAIRIQPPATIGWGGSRAWTTSIVNWEAPAFCHRPLYFEEANLERHGYNFGLLQPAVSAGTGLGRLLALPYLLAAYPPGTCYYTLGQARPGDDVPFRFETVPPSLPGNAAEAAAALALVALIP